VFNGIGYFSGYIQYHATLLNGLISLKEALRCSSVCFFLQNLRRTEFLPSAENRDRR